MGLLFGAFSQLRTLRSLDLSGNKFTNSLFDVLVSSLVKLPDLEEIALNNCNIGNQCSVALQKLAKGLR
jgi:Ran GTPase-activating protein (RanGAP) involved in mRNA processing and transport